MSDATPDEVIYTVAERHPDGTHHANGSGPNDEPCIAAFGEYEDAARLADSRSSAVAWVRAERLREVERERDKLIEGLVSETWRRPCRTMANVDDSGVYESVWEWRYGGMGDTERSKAEAIAALRRAAGLEGKVGR